MCFILLLYKERIHCLETMTERIWQVKFTSVHAGDRVLYFKWANARLHYKHTKKKKKVFRWKVKNVCYCRDQLEGHLMDKDVKRPLNQPGCLFCIRLQDFNICFIFCNILALFTPCLNHGCSDILQKTVNRWRWKRQAKPQRLFRLLGIQGAKEETVNWSQTFLKWCLVFFFPLLMLVPFSPYLSSSPFYILLFTPAIMTLWRGKDWGITLVLPFHVMFYFKIFFMYKSRVRITGLHSGVQISF